MKKLFMLLPVVLISILLLSKCSNSVEDKIDLAGMWQVKLDSLNVGVSQNWATSHLEGIQINLPGTLDDAGLGKPNTLKPAINNYVMSNLTRKHQYIGVAWYQKEIEISKDWKEKDITLSLERVIWESKVYVDGKLVGSANSLVGKHVFNLSEYLAPGKHLLTISIDNSNKFPLINVAGTKYPDPINQDMAHAYTNHTQIKWNGILGNMQLEASDKNKPKNLQVYPNYVTNTLRVSFEANPLDNNGVHCEIKTVDGKVIFNSKIETSKIKDHTISFEIEKPEDLELWDEFNPALYDITVGLGKNAVTTRFGYKSIETKDGNFSLNGKRIFLRGNLECVIFPLTGYPPMEKEGWLKLMNQAKSYGLNHLRFHSWCPPKAAFEAADEVGLYCQVELPLWSLHVGKEEKTNQFLKSEADKILKDYGNHPSFVLMSVGNELEGDVNFLNTLVAHLKTQDNRHLYTTTTFSFQKPMGVVPEPEDAFFVTQWTDKGWIRGQGIFNSESPKFDKDYSENSSHINIPLITHEIGQYAVYPDMREISKYTGVLEPLNFVAVKKDLEKKGLLELAESFTLASGKLAAILYKEEIERVLKTSCLDGFQLLQLQDFPGQGTALVGLLNAFWESKGIISAEAFRAFNSELVPLIRFEKAVYEDGELFKASIEVANFFKELKDQTLNWSITDDDGTVVKNGSFKNINLSIGNNVQLGDIEFPIVTKAPKRLTINIDLQGTAYKNNWHIWIYPSQVPETTGDILITSSFEEASTALENGKKVLLNPDYKTLQGIEGRFVPVFWSPVHFPNQPATMGVLLDEKHPAFNSFPTSSHTDWQWWDLCINSKSIITDSLPVTPIVHVIDNFVTNHHLANVFEARVGKGTLIFSSIDLMSKLNKRPVSRQLRYSLLEYMNSDAFKPQKTITVEDLIQLKINNQTKEGFDTKDIYN